MLTPTGVTVNEYNTAVKNDTLCHIRLTFTEQGVVFTDADFEQGGVTITTYLNGEQDLTMGRAVKTMLTAYMFINDKTRSLLWENECQLEIGADVNGSTVWTTLGYFTGEKPEKLNREDIVVFTAYDRMSKFETLADNWFASLTYPMTIQQLYASLCSYVGVQYVSGDELSNIMSRSYATAPITSNGLLCRDVLALIAEAAGCYAKIDATGKVKLVWFEDHTDYVVTGDDEFRVDSLGINFGLQSKTWEDLESYTWEQLEQMTWSDIEYYQQQLQIKCLSVKQTIDDVGVLLPTGGSGNTYMIVDNPFLTTANDTEVATYIQPILDRLVAFGGYLPMTVTCVGNPLVEAGDIITAYVKGEEVAMPIFVKEMTCTSACTDRYEATGNVKRQEITPVNREKLSQGGRFHIFRNDIDELYSELYDPTTGDVSILNQTASALGLSAAGIDIVGGKYVKIESGGTFDVDSTNFSISSEDKQMVSGYWTYGETGISYNRQDTDLFYMYPGVGNYPNVDTGTNTEYTVMSTGFGSVQFDEGVFTQDIHDPSIRYHTLARLRYSQYDLGSSGNYTLQKGGVLTFLYSDTGDHEHMTQGEGKISGLSVIEPNLISSSTRRLDLKDSSHECDLRVFGRIYAYQRNGTQPNIYLDPYQDNGRIKCQTIWAGEGAFFGMDTSLTITLSATDGVVYAYGFYNLSSREVKDDIKKMESKGSLIDKLNPVSFKYKGNDKQQRYGLIYEEVEEVIPELCSVTNVNEKETKAVNYIDLISILLKETQELRKRVAELEKRVNDLERR